MSVALRMRNVFIIAGNLDLLSIRINMFVKRGRGIGEEPYKLHAPNLCTDHLSATVDHVVQIY